MESRHVGIRRALGWERTPDGVEFPLVTEGLAAARVAVSAVAPRIVRVRMTPGAVAPSKGFSYVVARPAPGPWALAETQGRLTLRARRVLRQRRWSEVGPQR